MSIWIYNLHISETLLSNHKCYNISFLCYHQYSPLSKTTYLHTNCSRKEFQINEDEFDIKLSAIIESVTEAWKGVKTGAKIFCFNCMHYKLLLFSFLRCFIRRSRNYMVMMKKELFSEENNSIFLKEYFRFYSIIFSLS